MKNTIKLATSFILLILFAEGVIAQSQDNFTPNIKIGDGSGGRVWAQWRQTVRELPIEEVGVRLRRVSGGNDAYVNLRYDGGQTFENGKRVYLKDGGVKNISWDISGISPRGKQLVLNIYKGEAVIEAVSVKYKAPFLKPNTSSGGLTSKPLPMKRPIRPTEDDFTIDQAAAQECRENYTRRPRIEVGDSRPSGGLFSNKSRIKGNILGACIEEAGYFESGVLKDKFSIPYTSRFKRYPFEIQARTGRNGEVRVYTTQGDEVRIRVDEVGEVNKGGLF